MKVMNSMRSVDQEEILLILERAEGMAISKTNRFLIHSLMFIVLTFCSQGG
jgi:hypothetical protein